VDGRGRAYVGGVGVGVREEMERAAQRNGTQHGMGSQSRTGRTTVASVEWGAAFGRGRG
jgi:hypothetical protein